MNLAIESGITAVGAIANAVEDAIGLPGAIIELLITPHKGRAPIVTPQAHFIKSYYLPSRARPHSRASSSSHSPI